MGRKCNASLGKKDSRRNLFGKPTSTPRGKRLSIESLEPRQMLAAASFIHGVGGYTGTQDTVLYSISPNVNFGTDTGISVDQQDVAGVRQGLLKFDNIIGNGPGQIPAGSTINSARLRFSVFNDSNAAMQMSFYRMLTNWDQATATWNSFGSIGGVQASQGEAEGLPPDGILFDAATTTTGLYKNVDVTTSLRHWAAGESNFGWLIESAATNGWDFNTSESPSATRPILEVDYTAPSGAGTFQFINLAPTHSEGDSGDTVVNITVARLGGTTGAVDVDYTIGAGGSNPATAGTDFVAAGPTTLHFAAGETVKTIAVTLKGDTQLEGNETFTITLTNPTGGATVSGSAGVATFTIGDDDALINEVLANISTLSQPTDETNREYIELIGTPGASLNDYYFVVFEGEEEENAGAGSGIADLVINLSGQTFGSNGLLVITGTDWAYQSLKDAGTNQLMTTRLDGVGGRIEDSSQTYALIRSATPIVEGTDYDTVGAYENGTQTAVGTGVGILDQLPAGAQMVDSVGVVEGGGGDRDRVATTAAAGHPGVHVHQPDGLEPGNSNVTSDAVSRRLDQHTPSTIGVWFNGDIPNGGLNPIAYATAAPGATPVSVVAPRGAVITPGSPNILRNIFFTVTATSVDESAGTVTLTVQRSGDDSQEIHVNYSTVNGTAIAGQDFGTSGNPTQVTGQLTFGIGDNSEDITIPILTDSTAEGFESFNINLSNPTAPFLVTVGTATVTINDGDVLVKTFQDNVNGYNGTADTYLNSIQPVDPFGFGATMIIDEEAGTLTGSDARPAQGLLRFDDLFGSGGNQVPQGSKIFSAFLTLNVLNPTSADAQIRFFRMLQNWDESTATWTDPQGSAGGTIINGVTPDDVEAAAEPDAILGNPAGSGLINIPLDVDTIQAWANGTLSNFGWSIVSDGANDWVFASSDDFLSINPQLPKLTILYTDPSGAGTIGFSDTDYKVNENGSATIKVQRIGGSAGAIDVNWAIGAGTGSLADITGPSSGSLHFDAGEIYETITIPIFNDSSLERNEQLNLMLTGAGVTFDRPNATLTIRDNDFNQFSPAVLLNEVFINSPGLDSKHEFVELAGTDDAGLGSLYLAVINGDVGEGEGSTDWVVDLGPYLNGTAGTTIITALNNFGFRVPTGATQIGRAELDNEFIANDTATYALLYSPNSSLATGSFDYDWDNDGTLELPTGVIFVDSVANKDNGSLDQTYGPAANIIFSNTHPNAFVADAISRLRGNITRNNAGSWFNGDLIAAGDDPLVYDAPNSVGLPVSGAAMTPGEINTGTAIQSPLVSLTAITPNSPVGTITLTFSGAISQLLDGGGAFGVSITNPDGSVNPQINVKPTVTGLGTNTLTLAFTGPGVTGGILPTGDYRLNFVGNSLIGNGRAVDAANTAAATGSNHNFNFHVDAPSVLLGDYNGDNHVDALDYTVWRNNLGALTEASINGAGDGLNGVDEADFTVWKNHYGDSLGPGGGGIMSPLDPPGGGGLAAANLEQQEQQAAAPAALDLAFVDLAFAHTSTSNFGAKAAGADAARLRSAAGGSAPFDRSLLLAAHRRERNSGSDTKNEARNCQDHSEANDEFFSSLGLRTSVR